MSIETIMPVETDKVVRWPFFAGVGVVFFACFVMSWPVAAVAFSMLFLLWAPLFAIVVTGLLAASIWTMVRSAIKRHWMSVLSAAAFPVLALLALPASRFSGPLVDQAHFLLYEQRYLAEVAQRAPARGNDFVVFDWGGNPMVGFNRFLAFDKNGELSLAEKDRSASFQKILAERGLDQIRNVQRLSPHFYVFDQ
jgi:hypothetical protein